MASSIFWSARLTIAAIFLLGLCQRAVAQYEVPYCATFNTADSDTRNSSIYQSNSLCFNYCNGITPLNKVQYAFAVVQWQTCWCTDYAPSSSTTGCTLDCPGWQEEKCGNTSPSLFGYISLPSSPKGTKGPSAATSSVDQTPDTTTTSEQPSSTSSTSSSWTPTPVVSLETITGQVRTVTVTPTVPPNAQATNELTPSNEGGGGLGTGGAVGLTVGLVALVAIIAAAVFFFIRKRRRDQEGSDNLSRRGSSAGFGAAVIPSRTMSENSRYVLGTDGRRVVETWEPGETAEVRRSRLIPVDQRLDPFSPVYQRGDNKSRESVNTIRDDHDYSRRMVTGGTGILRATNPD
ncbi:hypothetical protein ONS95_001893 [Cadophora gregata]|uniref:uncharacterized protein n=1 Tax=Cadophora gregata TaxID=51156 RepID=UPI0026DDA198|nr:uncharacterized protein ONS95_001893 [Cadophora gregata]KAK0111540.1 hypothetical protein ONS95_001893 [Cadophora gregata]